MSLLRIGDKIINRQKLNSWIDRIFELRSQGLSQQEVAQRLGLDRAFISRLEGLGEIRQGRRLAVIGFPVLNKAELQAALEEVGVDFVFLLTDRERWEFVGAASGIELLNKIMDLIVRLRDYDVVVVIGSDLRIRIAQALLDREVIPFNLGSSPIAEDQYVDPEVLREIIAACWAEEER